ncbi:MAG: right-handed parallel beta-helix repeat-containing protein, partial [Oscillospiraceae bacterium]|nr:right-handed parallel beta-helix repeat-containing protein [Oscillospiraceae bacterium]
ADVEIVVEPRYANVLCFIDCSNVAVTDLTAGHTDTGSCTGSVVLCEDCTDIILANDDLYGCGVNGLEAEDCADIYVYETTIRDCSFGPMELSYCTGGFTAYNSRFVDSGSFGFYDCGEADIYFWACEFGEWESNSLYFRDDVETDDCIWSDITEYPDYGDGSFGDFRDYLEIVAFDAEVLAGTRWEGFELVIPEENSVFELPYEDEEGTYGVTLEFDKNGSGVLDGLYDEPETFRYEMDESGYLAYGYIGDDQDMTDIIWLYADTDEEESPLYMEFTSGDYVLWLSMVTGDAG